jgi:hypothetical protein
MDTPQAVPDLMLIGDVLVLELKGHILALDLA